MPNLSQITVCNFKSIVEATIDLASFTPLVGYNNAGKTGFLQAISWLLKKSKLPTDFYNDPETAVEVIGVISDIDDDVLETITAQQREKLSPYIYNGVLTVKRQQPAHARSVTDIRVTVLDTSEQDDRWHADPNGIDAAITKLFPDPIMIRAMDDAVEDAAKVTKSSTIGRLLLAFIAPLQDQQNNALADALSSIQSTLTAEGDGKVQELREADSLLSREVEHFFPGVELKIHIPAPDMDTLLKSGTVKVYDAGDGTGRSLDSMGHGTQRSIQMALIKCLAEQQTAKAASTTILLIDEPELYLHPQAIIQVRSALKKLAQTGYQIVFTTHSPIMIETQNIVDTLVVRKKVNMATHVLQKNKPELENLGAQPNTNLEHLFSLNNTSQFLFSDRILLLEGRTEKRLLPNVFQAVKMKSCEEFGVSALPLNGSGALPAAKATLQHMGFTVRVLADLDFAFTSACRQGLLANDDADLLVCKELLRVLARDHGFTLSGDGLPQGSDSHTAEECYEILAAFHDSLTPLFNLHEKLKLHGYWLWTKGAIEKHFGLTGKTDADHGRYLSRLEQGDVEDVVAELESVRGLCNWLTSDEE